ncbi:hypothetical protein O7632_04265 [Solwaraspora sp. WMMD406]|uniref:hypothetical protein n=1 Tax=Solwaraspora sp. WMMD406 TaxID=3016095 RepID=UPI00241729C6|nr:hypothetical protein [Solwaraspora sp. WMMD406]MDG4763326.1 hypothetical protein [Solwaraspora sp. WMMD406]
MRASQEDHCPRTGVGVDAHCRSVHQVPTIREQTRPEEHPADPVRPPPARSVPGGQEYPCLSGSDIHLDDGFGAPLPILAGENEKPVRRVDDLQSSADVDPSEDRMASAPMISADWGECDVDRPTGLRNHRLRNRTRRNQHRQRIIRHVLCFRREPQAMPRENYVPWYPRWL